VENNKAETAREIMSVKVTVDSIQKELKNNTSEVSRRPREHENKLEQKANVDKLKLQKELKSLEQEVVQLKSKTGDQMQVPVRRNDAVIEGEVVNSNRHKVDPKEGSSNAESLKVTGNLGSTEFALPFDENKGMNPVSHIRQKNFSSFVEYRNDCG
jgi:stress response protein YsnF